MAMGLQHYPKSVADAPRRVTAPSFRYLFYGGLLLVSLFAFLALYLGLIAGAGWLVYFSCVFPIPVDRYALLGKVAAIIGSGMLFLFLVKGLFKRHRTDLSQLTEISEREQPELYAFIRRLCRELKAPFPSRIFTSPEVNAAIIYDSSLVNLILPVKKHLLIGLGLANVLNMSEFKAVLAHEFGHSTQSSFASYVGIVNQVITDLVLGRDALDELLDDLRRSDPRIAIFAHLLALVLWLLRQLLAGAFLLVTLVRMAFTRQREFQADRVAVSVCGSDAVVHGLFKSDFAAAALGVAIRDLARAAQSGMYSRDVYFHQQRAAERIRRQRNDPTLGKVTKGGEGVQLFSPVDHGHTSIWDAHPSMYDREQSAKRIYVPGPEVEESPWTLFRDPAGVRTHATLEIYSEHLSLPPGVNLLPAEQVQAHLDGGRQEPTSHDNRYQGLYDGRLLEPIDVAAVVATARQQPWPPQRLAQVYDRVYNGGWKERLEQNRERRKELETLHAVASGQVKLRGGKFPFRGRERPGDEAKALLRAVQTEIEQDRAWMAEVDRDIFRAHYQMAETLQPGAGQELCHRYAFHSAATSLVRELRGQGRAVMGAMFVASGEAHPEALTRANGIFREARAALAHAQGAANHLALPALPELETGAPLSRYLGHGYLVPELAVASTPDGTWVRSLLEQIQDTHDRTLRIVEPSLVTILALQERIAAAWRASQANAVAATRSA
jgi:Zn-dependent protease with chaperone function